MIWFAIAAIVAVFAIVVGLAKASEGPTPIERESDDPYALSQTDPVEALSRYGVAENYDQLLDQGVDLSGLGYEPPAEQ